MSARPAWIWWHGDSTAAEKNPSKNIHQESHILKWCTPASGCCWGCLTSGTWPHYLFIYLSQSEKHLMTVATLSCCCQWLQLCVYIYYVIPLFWLPFTHVHSSLNKAGSPSFISALSQRALVSDRRAVSLKSKNTDDDMDNRKVSLTQTSCALKPRTSCSATNLCSLLSANLMEWMNACCVPAEATLWDKN